MTAIIILYVLMISMLALSIVKSREKTRKVLKVAGKALLKTAPALLTVLGIVGLTLGILTPETISRLVGSEAGPLAAVTAAVLGAVTLMRNGFGFIASLIIAFQYFFTISYSQDC